MSAAATRRWPILVGLLGGVAAGKSTVAAMFAARGAGVLDADALAHECLPEPDVRAALVRRFGKGILGPDGAIARPALAAVAFADAASTAALNAVVHPAVTRRIEAALDALGAAGTRVAVLDGAVLTEAGWAGRCDLLVFVDVPEDVREARAQRRGWPPGERARREAQQVPLADKRKSAKAVIRNGGPKSEAEADVAAVWTREIAPRIAARGNPKARG